jgi:hypothetical protein
LTVLGPTPRSGIVPGRLLVEQALLKQAVQNMADGAALEFEPPPLRRWRVLQAKRRRCIGGPTKRACLQLVTKMVSQNSRPNLQNMQNLGLSGPPRSLLVECWK